MEAGSEVIARARLICGDQHVVTSTTVLSAYRSDGIRRNGPLPLAAILPGSSSEVAGVVSACSRAGVPFVARGAGTSRSGGALPRADGVMIVLSRMRRVVALVGNELTLEAGVPVVSLPSTAGGAWLDDAPALGTVGGHVAETGSVGNLVALELVRPDGTLLRVGRSIPGYDLAGAFAGSRGRAGIAVTLTLRSVPTA